MGQKESTLAEDKVTQNNGTKQEDNTQNKSETKNESGGARIENQIIQQQQKEQGNTQVISFGSESSVNNATTSTAAKSFVQQQSSQIGDQLTNSRLMLRDQRDKQTQKVISEGKQSQDVNQVLLLMQHNQDELIEILDERIQLVTQTFEEKLLSVENKVDEICDRLRGFESTLEIELQNSASKEQIDALRGEVKQIVAISERYLKDDSKLNEISSLSNILHKSIVKEDKPTRQQLNPMSSKLSRIRERSKLDKQISDSLILKDLDEIYQNNRNTTNNRNNEDNNNNQSVSRFFNNENIDQPQTRFNNLNSSMFHD